MKFSELTQKQQQTLIREGTSAVASGAALIAAVRNLRKGRVGHALFYIVLWHGYNTNAEHNRAIERHKEIVAHHECAHRLAGVSPAAKSPRSIIESNFGLN